MQLLYVMDPMCSWCWAFRGPLSEFRQRHPELNLSLFMGGLAPDSDTPMPAPMQQKIEQIWHQIEQQTGATFNYDFWRQNTPRRSTYPACRAVICAGSMGGKAAAERMAEAIQMAYYQRALNPSDNSTLIKLADEIGLDAQHFAAQLSSEAIEQELRQQLGLVGQLGIGGFPALLLQQGQQLQPLALGYTRLDKLEQRYAAISS